MGGQSSKRTNHDLEKANSNTWQRTYITKHLKELQDLTTCNVVMTAHLQQENILSSVEIEKLNAEQSRNGRQAESFLLYKIIQTKTNGFEAITHALYECKQSGAFQVLINGFRENGCPNPLQTCSISIDYHIILETTVEFLGQKKKLKEIFPELTLDEMEELMEENTCDYDYIDIFITKAKPFVLLENTIPYPPKFYIPRSISNRIKVNPNIFQEKCPDVFVFREIDRVELSRLASPSTTSTSTNQVLELTSRFILLDCDDDWEELLKISPDPIHLLRCEVGGTQQTRPENENLSYILKETSGNSEVLAQFVKKQHQTEKTAVTEADFVKQIDTITSASGFCICDTPGMGKTWLLANVARAIHHRHPNRLILFVSLSKLAGYLQDKVELNEESEEIKHSTVNNIILDYATQFSLSKAILEKACSKPTLKMDLFFDGLDEVLPDHIQKTLVFLKAMSQQNKNIRIFVTSRPQLRRQLETTLGVIAHDILPFTQENQINFLLEFWNTELNKPIYSERKLQLFAFNLIQSLKESVNQEDRDLMGIPLQCRLLAEVYCNEARLFANHLRKQEIPTFRNISIFEMYKQFVDKKFTSCDEIDHVREDIKAMNESEKEKVKAFHVWKALELFFPEISEACAELLGVNREISSSIYLSFGILEQSGSDSNNPISFVHRTLAEFLVASFFADILFRKQSFSRKQNMLPEDVVNFFTVIVLSTNKWNGDFKIDTGSFKYKYFYPFKYPVIVNFLDCFFKVNDSIENPKHRHILTVLKPEHLNEILQSSALCNHMNIFRFILKNAIDVANVKSYSEYMLNKFKMKVYNFYGRYDGVRSSIVPARVLLQAIAQFSNVQMMKLCFELFFEYFNFDLTRMCQEWMHNSDSDRPLELAVRRCDYEMTEFLIGKFSYKPQHLIRRCIANSYNDSSERLTGRLDIYKLVISHTFFLPSCKIKNKKELLKDSEILGAWEVHLELITFLIQEGIDPFELVDEGKTIVHQAAKYLSPQDYHELCRFLIFDYNATALFQQNNGKWHSPVHYILKEVKNVRVNTIEMLLDSIGMNFNEINDDGDSMILAAASAWEGQSVNVMQLLVARGVDYQFKNKNGQNVHHCAAFRGNVKMVDYFLSLGFSLEEQDKEGNTPLLRAYYHVEMIKYLVKQGANKFVKDNCGNTIVHKAAQYLADGKDFHELIVFISKIPDASVLCSIRNDRGITPLEKRLFCEKMILPDTVKLLSAFPYC